MGFATTSLPSGLRRKSRLRSNEKELSPNGLCSRRRICTSSHANATRVKMINKSGINGFFALVKEISVILKATPIGFHLFSLLMTLSFIWWSASSDSRLHHFLTLFNSYIFILFSSLAVVSSRKGVGMKSFIDGLGHDLTKPRKRIISFSLTPSEKNDWRKRWAHRAVTIRKRSIANKQRGIELPTPLATPEVLGKIGIQLPPILNDANQPDEVFIRANSIDRFKNPFNSLIEDRKSSICSTLTDVSDSMLTILSDNSLELMMNEIDEMFQEINYLKPSTPSNSDNEGKGQNVEHVTQRHRKSVTFRENVTEFNTALVLTDEVKKKLFYSESDIDKFCESYQDDP